MRFWYNQIDICTSFPRIYNSTDEIKIGENGEILNKSPYLLKEDYKNPDYTNEVLVDGWFNTGDKGHLDDKGYSGYSLFSCHTKFWDANDDK